MSFFDTTNTRKNTFEKVRYLALTPGNHQVRVLGKPVKIFIHFLPGSRITLRCLGDGCPICKTNHKIYVENPDNYRKVSGYTPRQTRFLMNVLDRTVVKVCPQCQVENTANPANKFSPACYACETLITSVEPTVSNKIKVLGVGQENAEFINGIEEGKLDADGNKIGLNNFDLGWMVVKTSTGKNHSTPLGTDVMDVVEYDETKLYDLEKVTLELTESEILEVLKGVSLRDIFLARNPAKDDTDTDVAKPADVDEAIKKLFDA